MKKKGPKDTQPQGYFHKKWGKADFLSSLFYFWGFFGFTIYVDGKLWSSTAGLFKDKVNSEAQ